MLSSAEPVKTEYAMENELTGLCIMLLDQLSYYTYKYFFGHEVGLKHKSCMGLWNIRYSGHSMKDWATDC